MSRRLKKIGTAIFDIVGFINFRLQETKIQPHQKQIQKPRKKQKRKRPQKNRKL